MREAHLDALVAAAADGTALDGLRAGRDEAGYTFEVPDGRWEGLTEEAFQEVAADHPAYVSNWHFFERSLDGATDAGRAFLRWLERADELAVPDRYDDLRDGVERTWGELAIAARLGSGGERRYALRHADDRGADPDDLEAHDDPLDARELAKFDDRGRYRPLSTAPTLRAGWIFPDLGASDLLRAVDFVYPAAVANWHREREGDLDVTHWREAAERQTGRYDVVDELSPEAVEWATEACCVDSQCLKRRRWEYDDERRIDVDPGDGEFPCREPCSLMIAAAAEWARIEREEARAVEFELTPSEREQVEAIVDAVADGRVDEIREADFSDPANRYRARYLRAKRFDDG